MPDYRTTMYTFLMVDEGESNSADWKKVCDIKDYPDILAAPSGVEFTTMSHGARVYRPGLKDTPDNLQFTANYEETVVARIQALEGQEKKYALWFGGTPGATIDDMPTPTGDDGKIEVMGVISLSMPGKGINDPHEIQVNLMPSSDPVLTVSTTSL